MSATLLEQLAAFAAASGATSEVVDSVKLRMLDALGIALAASAAGLADGVTDLVVGTGGRAEASVVGTAGRYPAAQAALVNGTLVHGLDFDDTHLPSIIHPSASIVPAVLAVGEATGATGNDLVAAAAVGIEVTVRTGMGGYLPDGENVFFERGWHATSICGALGAAAAAGRLLGLDAAGIGHAIAIAASFSGGLLESNRSGGTVKRLHCGWAAHAGVNAAQLAARGYTGPASVLEGRFGFYEAYLGGRFDPEAVTAGLGERWELPGIFFKPYPANHYTHAGIDAALAIRERDHPALDRIVRIELGSSASALRTIGEPRAEKIAPRSGYHAQFSGPFTVATALVGGGGLGVWFDDFTDERARDERVLRLARLVETFVDPEADALFPRGFGAFVRVHLDDGRVLEERVMANRGGPERPLSEAELRHKYMLNATRRISPSAATRIAEVVARLSHEGAGAAARLMEPAR
jgi:2-methylcitrate dehydratase PrpD